MHKIKTIVKKLLVFRFGPKALVFLVGCFFCFLGYGKENSFPLVYELIDTGGSDVYLNGVRGVFDKKKNYGGGHVRTFQIDNIKYYSKKKLKRRTQNDIIKFGFVFESFQNAVSTVIASRILNHIFSGTDKRFPVVFLGYDPNNEQVAFYFISQDINAYNNLVFRTVYDHCIQEQKETALFCKGEEELKDLAILYVGLYLVGGGDPHSQNIVYSYEKNHFGSIDLDDAFKSHVSKDIKKEKSYHRGKESSTALLDFDCDSPLKNFLIETKSGDLKNKYISYTCDCPPPKFEKVMTKEDKDKMKIYLTPEKLLEAMKYIIESSDIEGLKSIIDSVIETIEKVPQFKFYFDNKYLLEEIQNAEKEHSYFFLSSDDFKYYIKGFLGERYQFMKCLVLKYNSCWYGCKEENTLKNWCEECKNKIKIDL